MQEEEDAEEKELFRQTTWVSHTTQVSVRAISYTRDIQLCLYPLVHSYANPWVSLAEALEPTWETKPFFSFIFQFTLSVPCRRFSGANTIQQIACVSGSLAALLLLQRDEEFVKRIGEVRELVNAISQRAVRLYLYGWI